MQPDELRPGNWVIKGRVIKEECQVSEYMLIVFKLQPDWLSPVPLNEMWLKKLGWEKNGSSAPGIGDFYWFEYRGYEAVNIEHGIFGIKEIDRPDAIANVRYVHELQNLMLKLTGSDGI